ncbi:DUF3304 domain-containing protein [Providencia stuartii]|uniref:DUF3304 domain-containing protein n=1 Tax=Providencia stuartii TaxID=588 RepID=UPI001FF613A2|nr:DUF3304 domain-containing protein [Providencia stuartii]MCK1143571.1 DUF3304 domain-containing protein [Providencia stuartii]
MKKTVIIGVFCIALFSLIGCFPEKKTNMLPANIWGFNHVKDTAVNWYKVNGARSRGATASCCIMVPEKWTPDQTVLVEWEVDPDAYVSSPPMGTKEFSDFVKKHEANYRHYSKVVPVPQYDEACDVKVHFLPCQEVKITLSCLAPWHPDYPIQEPLDQEEPAECPSPTSI